MEVALKSQSLLHRTFLILYCQHFNSTLCLLQKLKFKLSQNSKLFLELGLSLKSQRLIQKIRQTFYAMCIYFAGHVEMCSWAHTSTTHCSHLCSNIKHMARSFSQSSIRLMWCYLFCFPNFRKVPTIITPPLTTFRLSTHTQRKYVSLVRHKYTWE